MRKGIVACRWHAAKFGTPPLRSFESKILSQELGRLMGRFDAAAWLQAMDRSDPPRLIFAEQLRR
jgi:hypothetical protein